MLRATYLLLIATIPIAIVSPVILRGYAHWYCDIGTYHHLSDQDGKGSEDFWEKVILVGKRYLTLVIATVAFAFVYSLISGSVKKGTIPRAIISFSVITVVMVFSIRVGALADVKRDKKFADDKTERMIDLGYSFGMSLYFLFLIGLAYYSMSFVEGGTVKTKIFTGSFILPEALIPSFVIIALPFVAAVVGEKILRKTGVRKKDRDDLPNNRV